MGDYLQYSLRIYYGTCSLENKNFLKKDDMMNSLYFSAPFKDPVLLSENNPGINYMILLTDFFVQCLRQSEINEV